MIVIHSNGSKFYGEEPDSLAKLIEVLGEATLDPRFEEYGNFVIDDMPGPVRLFGNFHQLSHVFNIDGTPEELAEAIAAIRKNQATDAYRAARAALIRHRKPAKT